MQFQQVTWLRKTTFSLILRLMSNWENLPLTPNGDMINIYKFAAVFTGLGHCDIIQCIDVVNTTAKHCGSTYNSHSFYSPLMHVFYD